MERAIERIATALEAMAKLQQEQHDQNKVREAEHKLIMEKNKRSEQFVRKAYAVFPQLLAEPLTMGPEVLDLIIATSDPLGVLGHFLKNKEAGNRLSALDIDDAKREIEAIEKRVAMMASI